MPFVRIESAFDRAVVYPWKPVEEGWDELKWSLRSVNQMFEDKECPILILSAKPPKWLKHGGRVIWIERGGYATALSYGVQTASRILWMNDDIYLLRKVGWSSFDKALTEGELDGQIEALRASQNTWQVSLGNCAAELQRRGHEPVMRFSTHTPYLFEREKAIEILEQYCIVHKTPFETLYHNHHGTEHEPVDPYKAKSLPRPGNPLFLNNARGGPSPQTQDQLRLLLSTKPEWEK